MAGKPKVLAVDDESDQIEILKEWLGDRYEVVGCTSPAAALEAIAASPFDLMISDFSMPEMNGAQLASQVSKSATHGNMPILILTGIQDDLALSVIKSIPRIRLVQKPIRKAEFMPIIEEMLRQR